MSDLGALWQEVCEATKAYEEAERVALVVEEESRRATKAKMDAGARLNDAWMHLKLLAESAADGKSGAREG